MTLDEALSTLGLARGASPEEARRAYLRLLKKHKPEVDPEGFRRVRAAYEVTQGKGGGDASIAAPTPEPAAREEGVPRGAPDVEAEPARAAEPLVEPVAPEVAARERPSRLDEARALVATLEAAARDVALPVPAALEVVVAILSMHWHGELGVARSLEGAFAAWLAASGREATSMSVETAFRWELAREMGSLGDDFPLAARRAMAQASIAGELSIAEEPLVALRRRDRALADRAGRRLLEVAPRLAESYARWLAPLGKLELPELDEADVRRAAAERRAELAAKERKRPWYAPENGAVFGMVLVGLVPVVWVLVNMLAGTPPPHRPSDPAPAPPRLEEAAPRELPELADRIVEVCSSSRSPAPPLFRAAVAEQAKLASVAARRDQCAGVAAAAREIERLILASPGDASADPRLGPAAGRLFDALGRQCRSAWTRAKP